MVLPPRILSLVPSATDWVTDLGLVDRLVGVTHECDVGPGVPVVVEPAVPPDRADPAAVDAAVSAAGAEGRPLYRVDEERVADLAPTVILTQRLCEVCAVSAGQVERLAARLPGCTVVVLDGVTLQGVLDDGLRVGEALGVEDRARMLVARLGVRLDAVEAAVAERERPGVAFLEWPDPPWTAGHWVPDQIVAAGGRPTVGVAGAPSERADPQAFAGADVVVVGPCGYDLAAAVAVAEAVGGTGGWVADAGEVWAVDAHRCFSRPAAGLADGVEALAGILHPEAAGAPDPAVARSLARGERQGSAA